MADLQLLAHALLISSQAALFVVGTLSFILGVGQQQFDHFPSDSEWNRNISMAQMTWLSSLAVSVLLYLNGC